MAGLGPWRADRRIGVAVSGGADSLCLAWLASHWGSPVGLIVDHGLRPGSAEEARAAAAALAGFGMASHTLALAGLRVGSALAARARAARYERLLTACAGLGITDLLLGHHADDQSETLLMRRARPSVDDASGLAGMSAVVFAEAARLVRPLLGVPGARLRATLRVAGIGWQEDPSNRDLRAERARARAALALRPDEGASLLAASAGLAVLRADRERTAAAWLAENAVLRREGFALIPARPLPAPALAALLRVVGGADHAPALAAVRRLAASPRPATLGGVRMMPAGRLGPGLLLVREARAASARAAAVDGMRWDGRYRLDGGAAVVAGLHVGMVGDAARGLRGASALPGAVLAVLPGLWRADTLVAVPEIGYYVEDDLALASFHFVPPAPAAGAAFVDSRALFAEGVPNGV